MRNAHLVAVCALTDAPGSLGGMHLMEEELGHEIDRHEKEHPDVTVIRQIVAGPPRSSLLTAAHEAQMIVVGSRDLGGIEGMILGSVAQALLHHSPCPAGVVHPD
ncbi:MAG TPA: universal stress protein [Streptosporangiaceae bacterium]